MDSQDKLDTDFGQELENLIEKYLDKNLDGFSIVFHLMLSLKVNACVSLGDYHAMLGILTALLTDDLKRMFDEISTTCEGICAEKKTKTKKEKTKGKNLEKSCINS